MLCKCGGIFGTYRVKVGWAGKCNACGRRHTIKESDNETEQQVHKALDHLDTGIRCDRVFGAAGQG